MPRLSKGRRPDNGAMRAWLERITPDHCEMFFDRLHALSDFEMSPREKAELNRHCGKPVKIFKHGQMCGSGEKQWQLNIYPAVELWVIRQPNDTALAMLADLDDQLHLNYVEHAINLHYPDRERLEDGFRFFISHKVMPNRRNLRRTSAYGGDAGTTLYSSRRTVEMPEDEDGYDEAIQKEKRRKKIAVIDATYIDQPCAVTGVVDCLHHERRTCRSRNLKRIDIFGTISLPQYDHLTFWQNALRFADISSRSLGLSFSRKHGRDEDTTYEEVGERLKRKYGTNKDRVFVKKGCLRDPLITRTPSVQNVIDELRIRHDHRVDDLLTYADVNPLLRANDADRDDPCDLRLLSAGFPTHHDHGSRHGIDEPDDRPVPGGRVKNVITPPRSRTPSPAHHTTSPRSTSPSRSPTFIATNHPIPGGRVKRTVTPPARSRMMPPPTMQTSSHQHERKTTMMTGHTHMEWDIPPNASSRVRKSVMKKRVKMTVTPRQRFPHTKTTHSLRPIEYSVGRWGTDNEDRYRPEDHSDADVRRDDHRGGVGGNDRAGRVREDDRDQSPRPGTQIRKRR